jgi:hypothetical protein
VQEQDGGRVAATRFAIKDRKAADLDGAIRRSALQRRLPLLGRRSDLSSVRPFSPTVGLPFAPHPAGLRPSTFSRKRAKGRPDCLLPTAYRAASSLLPQRRSEAVQQVAGPAFARPGVVVAVEKGALLGDQEARPALARRLDLEGGEGD